MKNILYCALALFSACATPANKSAPTDELKVIGHDAGQATFKAVFQTEQGSVPGTLTLVELDDAKGQKHVFAITSTMLFTEGDTLVDADNISEFVKGFRVVKGPGQNADLVSSKPLVLNDIYQLQDEHTRVAVAFPILSGEVHTLPFASKPVSEGDKVTLVVADKTFGFVTEDSDIHAFGFEFQENTDAYRGAAIVDAEQAFAGILLDSLKLGEHQSVFIVRAEMIHDLLALTLSPNAQTPPYATHTDSIAYRRPVRWVSKSNEKDAISLEHGSINLSLLRFEGAETSCLRAQKEMTSLVAGDGDEPNYSDTLSKGIGSRLLLGTQRTFQRREKEGWAMEFSLICSDDDKTEMIYLLSGKKSELEAEREAIASIRESFTLK